MRGRLLIVALLTGTSALVALHFLLFHTYWDYSEGVYALSARLILHGGRLYTQMVGAQPPGVFVAGTVLLAIHDSLEWLRFGVALFQFGAGLIAAAIVLRVTGSRLAATLTPVLVLFTPWAVREHGALTPELISLPVMLGAAWFSGREGRGAATGMLCGLMVLIKLPYAIPALALVAFSTDRKRAVAWALGTLIVGFGLTTALAGSAFWRDVVLAQTHTGVRSLGLLKGFWAQEGWNVLGLLVGGGVAVAYRRQAADPRLLGSAIVLAVANIVTFLTNFKTGTGLNVSVPVEASLAPLAVIGTVFALRGLAGSAGTRRLTIACVLGIAFTVAQSVSLIASPHNPIPFLRAFSAPAWEILLTRPQVDAAVTAARHCPPQSSYGGPPLIALMAGRRPPAGQPDAFLPFHSVTLASVAARIRAAKDVCA